MKNVNDPIAVFEQIKNTLTPMSRDELKGLAEDAGCCVGTLQRWAEDKVDAPRLRTFYKVADALNYEIRLVKRRKLRAVA